MDRSARAQRQFIVYRDSGEPEALAEVFDCCAQELLLVAHHLARPGVAPEDLVQSTFLVAMRAAGRFRDDRPLMPWLCGILANVARNQNRLAARVPDADRLPHFAAEDPLETADAREFIDALRAAIRLLPDRQREVLTLRLIHGLTPTEIAHALSEPVGTVKSWLHRGALQLRRMLPAGFAASLAFMAVSENALGQVRDALIAAATSATSPTPLAPAPAAEAVSSAKLVAVGAGPWIAVVLVLATGLAAWFATRTGDRPSETAAAETRLAPPAAPVAAPEAPAREPVVLDESRAPAGSHLRVAGRFASDGAPASFAFLLEPLFGEEPAFRRIEAATSAAGFILLDGLPLGRYELRPDRAESRMIEIGSGETEVIVEFLPAWRVAGRVSDAFGRPVAGAAI